MSDQFTMIDLFAGLGGASSAMRDAGWLVYSLDIAGAQTTTIRADVRDLPLKEGIRPDLLWLSPPCNEFSDAVPGPRRTPSLELYFASLNAVQRLQPRFWILENVRGALPWLGLPARNYGPYYLWGYFPPITGNLRRGAKHTNHTRDPAQRARIPYELSNAVRVAVETWAGRCVPQRPTRAPARLPQLFPRGDDLPATPNHRADDIGSTRETDQCGGTPNPVDDICR
jgi:hypothetical protein